MGENHLGTVTIKCPSTGDQVSTGIETDRASFDLLPDVLSHSRCPVCGLEHAWWTREAMLAEPEAFPSP